MSTTFATLIMIIGSIFAFTGAGYVVYRIVRMRRALKDLLPRERYNRAIRENEGRLKEYTHWESNRERPVPADSVPEAGSAHNPGDTDDELLKLLKSIKEISKRDHVAPSVQTSDHTKSVLHQSAELSKAGQLVR